MNQLTHHDDERQALLTAFALQQLSGAEQAQVKASLADDPGAQAFVEQTRRLAGIVEGALSSENSPPTSAALRKEIEERLVLREALATPSATGHKRGWTREILVGAIAASLLGVLAIPAMLPKGDRPVALRGTPTATTSERAQSAPAMAARDEYDALRPSDRFNDLGWKEAHDAQGVIEYQESEVAAEVLPTERYDRRHGESTSKLMKFGGGNSSGQGQGIATPTTPLSTSSTPRPGIALPAPAEPASLAPTSGDTAAVAGKPAHPGELTQRVKALAEQHKEVEQLEALEKTADHPYREAGGSEQYDQIVENAFLAAKDHALSTFSIDVDTASYANTRRFLTGGQLPPPSAVRIEELINYFTYDDPQPEGNGPFSVNMELAECPWTPGHHLLRVGLKGREIAKEQRPNSNLVFLLDVSGSMQTHNKLPLVKQAMQMLVRQLTENDMVTIVVYAGQEGLALDTTSGDQKEKILAAIENLSAGGSTHASAGIQLAYDKAMQNFLKDGTNRVILCTDGDFNVGITDDDSLVKLITDKAKSNVFLSVLGFGMGNLKDAKMEKLADKGNGNYGYIDTAKEAQKVLVEQMSGSLITIAKDVKIQVEFNPAVIASYRQIGYENRVLAARDFDDDTKDAGEIGAGHSVTALYEVVLVGNEKAAGAAKEDGVELKYQRPTGQAEEPKSTSDRELTEAARSGELCTVKLRFKEPTGDKSELIEFPLKQEPKRFGAASENLRFASAVAAFGMVLRDSPHRGGASMSAVEEIASASMGKDPNGYRAEFLELVKKAQALGK